MSAERCPCCGEESPCPQRRALDEYEQKRVEALTKELGGEYIVIPRDVAEAIVLAGDIEKLAGLLGMTRWKTKRSCPFCYTKWDQLFGPVCEDESTS